MMFPQDMKAPPPQPVEDLCRFDTKSREVSIAGTTRGIENLKDCIGLDQVWVSKVKQGEFERIAQVHKPGIACCVRYESPGSVILRANESH